ncbi:cold shock domain-containing protein [Seongchinamella sediminis]|uniref:Cold shock domain-containing protein n=1 Tax=Seongchinamella sediminis TaxID=2283635 RepID=A0A3L7DVK5_9GAMM|nr:cold shock domain-containing protein [Seongchinamella sediminis]
MNLVAKIVIATLVAVAAAALNHFAPAIPVPIVLLLATVATVLLASAAGAPAASAAAGQPEPGRQATTAAASGVREEGEVKWFNVSKGFGFITKDNGDEIFVHFRSIRGDGRRSLRDGQRVSFVEAQTEKGPQAEDVEAL